MLGRDAHIISNLSLNFVLQSHMSILCSLVCHTILKRECICETMNPGPLLIIRNTFPITFAALLFSEIIKTENTKTLYLLHSSYKTQKYIPYHCHNYCHHPCIFIYHHCIFISCFAFILSLISFSHLVLDNHLVRLRAQSNLLCLQEI